MVGDPREWELFKEYPDVGRYKIRVLQTKRGDRLLDIREYVDSDSFEGFTRRGVRVGMEGDGVTQLEALVEILSKAAREHSGVGIKVDSSGPSNRLFPAEGPVQKEEVLMKHCTLCQREIPLSGPASGIGYHEETLCGVCLKSAQKVCPHALKKEDGVTCRDCGARPVTVKRVALGAILGVKAVAVGFAKLFMMYTLPSIIGTAVVGGVFWLIAKKMGFL